MKKSRIKQIIKEVLLEEKGYSKYIPGGETSGLDKKTLDNILLRIAKGEKPSEEENSVARGNRILDKADPENVKRILGDEVGRMQELAGLKQEIKVNKPGFPYFQKWKNEIIEHMKSCQEDDMYVDGEIEEFENINDPYEAIDYLVDIEYLHDNDEDRDGSINFIETGQY